MTYEDYHVVGGADGLLSAFVGRQLELLPDSDRGAVLKSLLYLCDPSTKTSQRLGNGLTLSELASKAELKAARLKPYLDRFIQQDSRLLEPLESDVEPRYRLVHDRLAAALRRQAGIVLAEVDHAKQVLEFAYASWIGGGQNRQYLLRSKELKLVEKFEGQLPWNEGNDPKRLFFKASVRRRRNVKLKWAGATAAGICAVSLLLWIGSGFLRLQNTDSFSAAVESVPASQVNGTVARFQHFFLPLDLAFLRKHLSDSDEASIHARNLAIALVEIGDDEASTSDMAKKIRQTLFTHCRSDLCSDLPSVSAAFFKCDGNAAPQLWALVDNIAADNDRRLKAAFALALSGSTSKEQWEARADFLSAAASDYAARSPRELGQVAECLTPIAPYVMLSLYKVATSGTSPVLSQMAGRLLLELADINAGIRYLLSINESSEFKYALDRLGTRFQKEVIFKQLTGMAESDPRRTARRVVAELRLLRSGNAADESVVLNELNDRLRRRPYRIAKAGIPIRPEEIEDGDPSQRTELIRSIADGVPRGQLASLIDRATVPDTQAALILALGASGDEPEKAAALKLQAIAQATDDPEVYSAVGWVLGGREAASAYDVFVADEDLRASVAELLAKHGYAALTPQATDDAKTRKALLTLQTTRTLPIIAGHKARAASIYENSLGLTMVLLPGGEALIGDSRREPHKWSDETFRTVHVEPFELATTKITAYQFWQFTKANGSPEHRSLKNRDYEMELSDPVNQVSWYEAAEFCNWLSKRESLSPCYLPNDAGTYAAGMKILSGPGRNGYRLPTNAEWEFACRAGSKMRWHCGDDPLSLLDYSFFWDNTRQIQLTWPVAGKMPNQFGLFDMHGDVADWCNEPVEGAAIAVHGSDSSIEVSDSQKFGARGGCVFFRHGLIRCAARRDYAPTEVFASFIGFRVARSRFLNDPALPGRSTANESNMQH